MIDMTHAPPNKWITVGFSLDEWARIRAAAKSRGEAEVEYILFAVKAALDTTEFVQTFEQATGILAGREPE